MLQKQWSQIYPPIALILAPFITEFNRIFTSLLIVVLFRGLNPNLAELKSRSRSRRAHSQRHYSPLLMSCLNSSPPRQYNPPVPRNIFSLKHHLISATRLPKYELEIQPWSIDDFARY
jgi:hypothetical protein